MHTPQGREVDFLARYPTGKEELIQVCASLDDPAARERETQVLLQAAPLYPKAASSLIAPDIPAALEIPSGIALHSAIVWMLVQDE